MLKLLTRAEAQIAFRQPQESLTPPALTLPPTPKAPAGKPHNSDVASSAKADTRGSGLVNSSVAFERRRVVAALALMATVLVPADAFACACGCGVFDVGGSAINALPTDSDTGLSVWFRYSYMNQNRNWEHGSSAPASDNQDKEINTSFYSTGGEYMINPNWTVMAELPVYARHLTTTDDGTVFGPPGGIYTGKLTALGDLQLNAMYTGFSSDMTTGLSFGVKLPTGDFTGPRGPLGGLEFDRDSLPGTGSTDLMIGGYHIGNLNALGTLAYFVQARYEAAIATQEDYRPGNEADGAAGITYDLDTIGPLDDVTPLVQLIGSWRLHDTEANADPLNSGYKRLLVAPGIQMRIKKFRIYADVEKPIYQYTNAASSLAIEGTSGQLVASTLYKLQLAYDF